MKEVYNAKKETEKKIKQRLSEDVINYYINNKQNTIRDLCEKFNLTYMIVNGILNKYLKKK